MSEQVHHHRWHANLRGRVALFHVSTPCLSCPDSRMFCGSTSHNSSLPERFLQQAPMSWAKKTNLAVIFLFDRYKVQNIRVHRWSYLPWICVCVRISKTAGASGAIGVPDILLSLAHAHYVAGNLDATSACLKQALHLEPASYNLRFNLLLAMQVRHSQKYTLCCFRLLNWQTQLSSFFLVVDVSFNQNIFKRGETATDLFTKKKDHHAKGP